MQSIKYAIPSYRRSLIIKTHTLALLEHYKIPKKSIYIFVSNSDEYYNYKTSVDNDEYNIIIGQFGLDKQRNFITNYFKNGQYIVNLDDDIKNIMILNNQKVIELDNLQEHIKKAFRLCEQYNAYIWGIHQTQNPLNLRNSISFDFSFIVGFFWGCINRHKPELDITMPIKEDYERTIKYWLMDKTIVKLNYLSANTCVYKTEGGLQELYPDRTEMNNFYSNQLVNMYSDYFTIRNTQLNNANKSKYCELRCVKNTYISKNNYYTELPTLNTNDDIIKKLIECIADTDLKINKKRLNSGIGISQTFGQYKARAKKGLINSKNNIKYPELYKLLLQFYDTYVKQYLPDYTSIQVNKNYKTQLHVDKNNNNLSYIVGLGNYKGGELILNSYQHQIHNRPILFNGSKWEHGTENFTGQRYSIVFFKLCI